MTWGFLWLMLALKIPIAALIYLVWWAIKQTPEQPESSDGGGGSKLRRAHPRKPFPRRPRRGPHGDPPPPAPARMRTVRARARKIGHGGTGGHSSS
ncbi:MAG: hypothetical protein ACXVFQ_23635 [Solirubrobacteraceae bacterium]